MRVTPAALAIIAVMATVLAAPAGAHAYAPGDTLCATEESSLVESKIGIRHAKVGECFTIAPGDEISPPNVYSTDSADVRVARTGKHYETTSYWDGRSYHSVCTSAYPNNEAWIAAGSPTTNVFGDICIWVPEVHTYTNIYRYPFDITPEEFDWLSLTPTTTVNVDIHTAEGEILSSKTMISYNEGVNADDLCYAFIDHTEGNVQWMRLDMPKTFFDYCLPKKNPRVTMLWDGEPAPPRTTSSGSDESTTSPAPASTTIIIPRSAARCAGVRAGSTRVAVRSTRMNCRTARNIVLRYARTLRSPRGWTCSASVTDSMRRARCTRKATRGHHVRRVTHQASAYGIWRSR